MCKCGVHEFRYGCTRIACSRACLGKRIKLRRAAEIENSITALQVKSISGERWWPSLHAHTPQPPPPPPPPRYSAPSPHTHLIPFPSRYPEGFSHRSTTALPPYISLAGVYRVIFLSRTPVVVHSFDRAKRSLRYDWREESKSKSYVFVSKTVLRPFTIHSNAVKSESFNEPSTFRVHFKNEWTLLVSFNTHIFVYVKKKTLRFSFRNDFGTLQNVSANGTRLRFGTGRTVENDWNRVRKLLRKSRLQCRLIGRS